MSTFLVVLPVFFCALLVLLQLLVDQELSGREYRCGCQCLACCDWIKQPQSSTMHRGGMQKRLSLLTPHT